MISLAPSSASRWSTCKASPGFIEANRDRLPPQMTVYAHEGVDAHNLACASLVLGWNEKDFPSKEMANCIKAYCSIVKQFASDKGDDVTVEEKLPLFYMPKRNGILDVCIVNPQELKIIDLKYGAGVSVSAENNLQMQIYARNKVEELKKRRYLLSANADITMMIHQPRAREGDPLRIEVISLKDLIQRTDELGAIAAEIQADPLNQPFAPSEEACKFCEAKGICTARSGNSLSKLPPNISISVLPKGRFPDPGTLTDEQVGAVCTGADDLRDWLKSVEDFAFNSLEYGTQIPGVKLVEGKKHRIWTDQTQALDFLKNHLPISEIQETSLISPSAAEKLLKLLVLAKSEKDLFSTLVTKPEGSSTLVIASDKRPAINQHITELFYKLD